MRAIHEEGLGNFQVSRLRCSMQWGRVIFVSGICVSATLKKDQGNFGVSTLRCLMKRSRPILVLYCHIDTLLDDGSCGIGVTALGRQMQRREPWCFPAFSFDSFLLILFGLRSLEKTHDSIRKDRKQGYWEMCEPLQQLRQ